MSKRCTWLVWGAWSSTTSLIHRLVSWSLPWHICRSLFIYSMLHMSHTTSKNSVQAERHAPWLMYLTTVQRTARNAILSSVSWWCAWCCRLLVCRSFLLPILHHLSYSDLMYDFILPTSPSSSASTVHRHLAREDRWDEVMRRLQEGNQNEVSNLLNGSLKRLTHAANTGTASSVPGTTSAVSDLLELVETSWEGWSGHAWMPSQIWSRGWKTWL